MQNKNNNRKDTMSKIRMNTELRNKLFNKMKHTFENEATRRTRGISSIKRSMLIEQYITCTQTCKRSC